ncbi:MAG: alpha/beta fold hydrolase [Azospirillum sp.]|nr:alpha/beta fold hydrolase [Azospirillum sp.]
MPGLIVAGTAIECRRLPGPESDSPTLIFLHEGLGSAGQWHDFPDRLTAALGMPGLVYSRPGYGKSETPSRRRGPDYLQVEALEVLPRLLDRIGITEPILIGHSDGASIALIHAGAARRRCRGIVLEAPHVLVEEITLAGIRDAVAAWPDGRLRRHLARHHPDPDRVFRAWHETWLEPGFRDWNIEDVLPGIACPTLVIQGVADQYGTPVQVDAIAARVSGGAETLLLPGCGHVPHRERTDTVLAAMAGFIRSRLVGA